MAKALADMMETGGGLIKGAVVLRIEFAVTCSPGADIDL
jgi:hypothetical protein